MTAEQARTPGRPGDETSPEILSLLQSALAPVEPPASLRYRIFESVREARAQERRCAQVSGLLSAYVDGELTTKQVGLVEAHVSFCDRCAQELQALRMIVGAAGTVTPIEPPAGLRTRIAAAIADQSGESLVGSMLRGLRTALQPVSARWAAGAAVAALAVALVISMPQAPKQAGVAPVARKPLAPAPSARVAITPSPAASVRALSAKAQETRVAYRPATRIEKRRSPSRRVIVAKVLRTTERKLVLHRVKPSPKSDVPTMPATNTADTPTTVSVETKTVEVAAAPPAPVTKPEARNPDTRALVKVAFTPIAAFDKAQSMMKQIKDEVAMHRSEARSATVAIFRF